MYITQRFETLLSSVAATVGTTAIKVSGGTSVLSSVSATYVPNRYRQALRITNTGSTNLYLGSTSGVTATNGGGWFKTLAPGEYYDDLIAASVPRYVIGSGAGGFATLEEYQ
jgi:hypothetical protein